MPRREAACGSAAANVLEHLSEFLSAGAAWTAIVIAVMGALHRRRVTAMSALEKKIEGAMAEAKAAHSALQTQMTDVFAQVKLTYVPKSEMILMFEALRNDVTEFREAVADGRKEMGEIHKRVDDLFRSVEWRRQNGSNPADRR